MCNSAIAQLWTNATFLGANGGFAHSAFVIFPPAFSIILFIDAIPEKSSFGPERDHLQNKIERKNRDCW